MKKRTNLLSIAMIGMSLSIVSCSDEHDDDHNHDENELITTVKLTLKNNVNANDSTVAIWKDLDGDGGANPAIDTLRIKKGVTYSGKLVLLDESKSPVTNITNEVKSEADEHLFVYKTPATSGIGVTITDKDSKNLPIGILSQFTVNTTAANNSTLNILLRHQPGTKDGTETPGSTDVDVIFPTKVQ